jgi:preprotein translocase subunit SecE
MNNLLYILLAAAGIALFVWAARKHFFRFVRVFCGEMVDELKKATWPTKAELRDSTVIVIAAAVILGVFTSISDFSLAQVVILFTDFVS